MIDYDADEKIQSKKWSADNKYNVENVESFVVKSVRLGVDLKLYKTNPAKFTNQQNKNAAIHHSLVAMLQFAKT